MVKLWGRYTVVEVGRGQFVIKDGRVYSIDEDETGFVKGYRIQSGGYFDIAEPWKRGLDVEFEVKGHLEKHEDDATIRIFNLDKKKAWETAIGNPVRLRSGYITFNDIIFSGYVKKVETEYRDTDVITVLRCLGRGSAILQVERRWNKQKYGTSTWSPVEWNPEMTREPNGHTWDQRIRKVLEDYNFPIGYIHPTVWWLEKDHIGDTAEDSGLAVRFGQSWFGPTAPYNEASWGLPVGIDKDWLGVKHAKAITMQKSLDKVVQNIKEVSSDYHDIVKEAYPDVTPPPKNWTWSYYVRNGRFFFVPLGMGVWEGFVFSKKTGLLDVSASRRQLEGFDIPATSTIWQVKTLLFPRLQVNSIIKVEHRKLPNGEQWMQVADFEHTSDSVDHISNITCITRNVKEIWGDVPYNVDADGNLISTQRRGLI